MSAYGFAHLRSRRNHSDVIEYLERIQATLDPFSGHFVIHGPPTEVVEGTWPGSMVLIEFPSLAEARAWYDSPAYRAILRLRTDHIEGDLLLIEGVGPNYDPAQRARTLRTEADRAGQSSTYAAVAVDELVGGGSGRRLAGGAGQGRTERDRGSEVRGAVGVPGELLGAGGAAVAAAAVRGVVAVVDDPVLGAVRRGEEAVVAGP